MRVLLQGALNVLSADDLFRIIDEHNLDSLLVIETDERYEILVREKSIVGVTASGKSSELDPSGILETIRELDDGTFLLLDPSAIPEPNIEFNLDELRPPPPPPTPRSRTDSSSEVTAEKMIDATTNEKQVAPGSRFACLVGEDTDHTTYPLLQERASIGRSEGSTIRLQDASVSSTHAEVERTEQGHLLRDTGSSNGTFVNGERIREHLLRDGDRIRFGSVLFSFAVPALNTPGPTSSNE